MNTLSYLLGETDGAFTLEGCILCDVVIFALIMLAVYFYFHDDDRDLPFDDIDEEDDTEGGEDK